MSFAESIGSHRDLTTTGKQTFETEALPRWDMTPVFPSLESAEFQQAFDAIIRELQSLLALCDRCNVRRRPDPAVTPEYVRDYEEVTGRLNSLLESRRTLNSYIGCFVSTDARDEVAQSRESLLDVNLVALEQIRARYTAWIGSSDIEALLEASEVARNHAYFLRCAKIRARHQMSEEEEALAAELGPSTLFGWVRLHGNISALLTVPVTVQGEERMLPMSAVRSLGADPDRETRKAAFEAELKTWESVSVPMAAALNGVKGYQQTLRRKRHYADDVEPTLLYNGIDRRILEAMQEACLESFPDFHRYLRAKARVLGLERLAWYDLTAPVGTTTDRWTWQDAQNFILKQFGRYSERIAAFAERSFREQWIDAEPRIGKEGGAYCTGILPGISRVFMNYDGSFTSVSTLAHELGHAYHNLNLEPRLPLQSLTPSTLAETASIFCETLAFDAALESATPDEKLVLLDTSLERDLMVVVDIHSRFLFEKRVFERRAARDLTVKEFCSLMTQAQRETFGEEIDPLHPYMWAVKGHYYGPTFYNYPYTFGLLFARGLYAQYQQEPDAFRSRYDTLLSETGLADALTLGQGFGVDISSVAFWRASLDIIRTQIAEYADLVEKKQPRI